MTTAAHELRPADEVCALRAVWRHRGMLPSHQAWHVQYLQKALTRMNVQPHHVIAEIVGVTGQTIVRAASALHPVCVAANLASKARGSPSTTCLEYFARLMTETELLADLAGPARLAMVSEASNAALVIASSLP